MTITELGAIGELVGGVAVVATLIYLAVQVRQNTRQLGRNWETARLQVLADQNQAGYELRILYCSHPEVADLVSRGSGDYSSLSFVERIRYDALVGYHMDMFQTLFNRHSAGIVEDDMWNARKTTFDMLIASPGFRDWWKTRSNTYMPGFRAFLAAQLESSGEKN